MDNQYTSYYLYKKYQAIGGELIDLGITSIDADGTMPIVIKNECDPACGCQIEPIYRWVQTEYTVCVGEEPEVQYRWTQSGTTCIGYDKYQNNIKEQSTDGGTTWTVVTPVEYSASTLIESDSPDCGYVPPTPTFDGKYKLTLNDSSVVTGACDSTSAVTSGEVATQYSGSVVSAEIGNCTTSIGYSTFYACRSLTSCTIPSSVTSIGENAFRSCTGLTNIDIPNSVTSIDREVFYGCSSLTSLTIPDSVTSIGDYAFNGCTGLTSIDIPSGVTSISSGLNSSFKSCSSLSSITVDSNNTVYDSRNNCNAIIKTSTNTLIQGCSNTVIPSDVTSIGTQAFYGCSGLTSVIIPSGVRSISYATFFNCSSLTSIEIPNNVTYIGQDAFYRCSGLTSVKVLATTPPALGNSAFDSTNDCPIYVPAASLTDYQTAWSTYASRIQAIP